ncbi:hypothetical protein LTR70_004902 [Exophiala xenobiotica]|uniref:Uncharacterized protein n=1 Tax=Lithohypha guttulata TaxID=1690604 RepID=A0ABR0KBS7_9EURO|nr:hypothetical protein LTR24_004565 [Lithohypha guttulata]KAK5319718.1 hypothetical protein LTR70_004902 [Exophiala xenobiotica]
MTFLLFKRRPLVFFMKRPLVRLDSSTATHRLMGYILMLTSRFRFDISTATHRLVGYILMLTLTSRWVASKEEDELSASYGAGSHWGWVKDG